MSYTIQLTLVAQDDLTEAVTWYDEQNDELGDRFLDAVYEMLLRLEQHPFIYQKRFQEIRQATLKAFPFAIYYTVDDSKQVVVVQAVLHTSRNPQIWKDRL